MIFTNRARPLIGLILALTLLALGACGEAPAPPPTTAPVAPATAVPTTSIVAAPSATPVVPASATAIPPTEILPPTSAPSDTPAPPPATVTPAPPTKTPRPPAPPTKTPSRATPSATAQAARPTATDEPDECFLSTGQVINWQLRVAEHHAEDTQAAVEGLQSPCVDNRWLALWALGSIHDPATRPAIEAYLAAHPAGDWRRDAFDLVPLARTTLAYMQKAQDAKQTYTVDWVSLYSQIPHATDTGGRTPGPVLRVPPGTALTLLAQVPTDGSVPDHGGETALVYERVQRVGDAEQYYMDVSAYVAATPRYFVPATPAAP